MKASKREVFAKKRKSPLGTNRKKASGTLEDGEARLCARGFTQKSSLLYRGGGKGSKTMAVPLDREDVRPKV